MKVYVRYSKEYPYLPEFVALSKAELARKLNTSVASVLSSFSHGYSNYAEVEIEDEEESIY